MALLFTLLCGFSLSVLGYFGYFFERGHFIYGTEEVIDTEIRHLSPNQLFDAASSDENERIGRLFLPFGPNGEVPEIISGKIDRLKEGLIVFNHPISNKTYAAKIHTFNNNQKMLVGVDVTEAQKEFRFMQWLSIISIGLIILVVLVSFLISVFVAKGTNRIATTAQNIMDTGDLSKRLEVSSHWDDLSKMASTLNLMLDRIESLMGGLRQMSDNIAHDLRTPLTRLRNHIEEAKKDSAVTSNEALLNEADKLLNTFNALLRISRIETEKKREHFKAIALKPLLEDVIAFYEPLAELKNIRIHQYLIDATYHGDKDLLFQAYANILDNAIKYTPELGEININMKTDGEHHLIEIEDTGGGVAEKELEKIFQRFYRSDVSRSSSGTGLGLSLVKAVFDLHHAEILLRNTGKGLSFITKL
ncbi:MAG TPA: HAMP domain-containing sensor histidine kinase [Methylophilaceae bacterium]|nr:HAMP domain-containing sensor histidine kinase [Methylophilaceae bacterium]